MWETLAKIFAPIAGMLGYFELRMSKKANKDALDAHIKGNTEHLGRIEARQMMLENHLMGKALSKKEVEDFIEKNNY